MRDALAALKHFRPAEWVRNPIETAERPSGRGVLVTGATGFIGGHVVRALRRRGDTVWVWTRDADRALARFGPHVHVVTNLADIPADARIDAVVNLAGAPVIGPPWTKARRQLLIDSRVKTTQAVLDWCATRASAAARAGDARAPSASTDPPAMTGSRKISPAQGCCSSRGCAWSAKRRRMPRRRREFAP